MNPSSTRILSSRTIGSSERMATFQHFRCLLLVLIVLFPTLATGQSTEATSLTDIQFGIDGKYRSGRWTPVFLRNVTAQGTFELESLDGEAVRYAQTIEVDPSESIDGQFCTYIPAGPPGAPIEIRAVDSSGNTNPATIFRKRLLEGLVAPERPWVVAIGSSLKLDELGKNELLGVRGSLDVSLVRTRTELPNHWIGFDGVDLLVISGQSIELLRSLAPVQQEAIKQWILGGGHVLVSLGARGPQLLEAAPWLSALLQAEAGIEVFQAEPEGIETFVSAKTPIQSFKATRLTNSGNLTLLAGRNAERQMVPMITLHSAGLGKATVFAGGLEEATFSEWKQYSDLITRMLPELSTVKRERRDSGAIAADVRYEDLAGQVRVSLDRFVVQSGTGFSVIAAIVLALIGLIGPLDYFLVNRWLGRPLLGWLSFPITIAAFSCAIIFWNQKALPTSVNRITVLDMDSETQVGRAFTWAQIYCDSADRIDFQYQLESQDRVGAERQGDSPALLTGPWGYAGSIYGGIEVAGEDIRLPTYQLETSFQVDSPVSSQLIDVPLAPKSSRGIASRWRFTGKSIPVIDLKRRIGSDLLTGSLINPFEEDLLDGYLIYRNLAYIMPTRVPGNSRIASIESLPTKNFRWRLNRRQTVEESSRSEPWNPASDDNLDRLMEIVMFYKAAGGHKYAGLENRELANLDLSEALAMDKAIIVGRLAQSPAVLKVNGEVLPSEHVNESTYVRMIIPITGQASRRGDVEK